MHDAQRLVPSSSPGEAVVCVVAVAVGVAEVVAEVLAEGVTEAGGGLRSTIVPSTPVPIFSSRHRRRVFLNLKVFLLSAFILASLLLA